MRSRQLAMLLAAAALAAGSIAGSAAAQQGLVCAGAPAGKPCDAFHYHVQMYRPDTKQFVDVTGGTPYATQAACERAREVQVAANAAVVSYFVDTKEQQYPADRIAPCHCDMTADRSSPSYLPDAQRTAQLRNAEDARLRVRERLLDNKITTDSPLIRGLYADPPVTPMLAAPKLVPVPTAAPLAPATSTDELRATKTIDTAKPAVAALDLPLVEIGTPAAPEVAQEIPITPEGEAIPVTTPAAPTPAAAEPVIAETVVDVPAEPNLDPQPSATTTPEGPMVNNEASFSAEETAERFISYETQRITNVLKASSSISDETMKSKIFEACMQRIQLLSNLRLLIEGSGSRSRLATAARAAESEAERLGLIGKLFGDAIRPHWAPQDAADVVLEVEEDITAAPERALRDTTGRYSAEQKKRALYLVLAQTQPTEDQRLWLTTVVEGFLR